MKPHALLSGQQGSFVQQEELFCQPVCDVASLITNCQQQACNTRVTQGSKKLVNVLPLHALFGTAGYNFQVHSLQVLRWPLFWSTTLVALVFMPGTHCISTLHIVCILLRCGVLIILSEKSSNVRRLSSGHCVYCVYNKLTEAPLLNYLQIRFNKQNVAGQACTRPGVAVEVRS